MKPFIKKSRNWRNILLFGILAILVIVALNFFQNKVRNFFYLISAPIQKTLWQAGNRASDFFEAIVEMKNLKKENEELKSKLREILAKNAALLELKKENETLRVALNLGLEKDFKLTLSQVIGKDISQDLLIIDKGQKDGISKDLPVINQEKVLIGKISEVYENFSKVTLISHKESSFDGKVLEKNISGLVKGKGNLRFFLDLLPKDSEISQGDRVVTSALGGIFPEGLLIGEIKEVKKSDIEPFQQAEISPFFDIKELEYLFIVLNFK